MSADRASVPWGVIVPRRGWRAVVDGEADLDVEAAFGPGVSGDGGAVGGGDCPDDGQAEAVSVVVGGAGGGEPLEGFEEAADLCGRDDRAGVSDGQDSVAILACGGECNGAARDV